VARPSQDAVRGMVNQVYMPPLLLTYHANYDSMVYGNRIQNRPHDRRGAYKAQDSRQNPPVRSKPPRANRARDKATQGVASSWHFLGPH
jgi:hypothetical protein